MSDEVWELVKNAKKDLIVTINKSEEKVNSNSPSTDLAKLIFEEVMSKDVDPITLALHEVKDNKEYAHASSLILWDQPTPLALVYREGHRDELFWAPCWNCRDGGKIAFDDEKNEVIITHKW